MSNAINTEFLGEVEVHRCSDCRNWVRVDGHGGTVIKHSKKCDHGNEQPASAPVVATPAKDIRAAYRSGDMRDFSDYEIQQAYRAGVIGDPNNNDF